MRAALSAILVGLAAVPAWASDTPQYAPTPSWVLPAPAIKGGGNASLPVLAVIDQQTRIADGTTWSYRDLASRAVSAEALAQMGTVTLNWQPYHGDLIIHRVDIIRDGLHIDALKTGPKFNVIRREEGLERLEMDGILTATLQVQGLRVGDVLDVAYSETIKDPALKGEVQSAALALSEPFKVDFARARILWPKGKRIEWKAYPAGIKAAEDDKSGWHELTFQLPGPKEPEVPFDAPKRFKPIPAIEISSFANWPAVSAIFAPLYRTDGLIAPGTPLADEVARIRAKEADPKRRAAAALAIVQDRIRYFANGMNGGNYVPQSPAQTWAFGYGDCKAKTLLLLAMLHELGIKAEPVVANVWEGDQVTVRLPAPEAFNHVLVHANIAGEDLWLDGTQRGSRFEDLADPPPFRYVLPVRDPGANLLELPSKAPSQPIRTVSLDIDESAAIASAAPFSATVQMRGAAADGLRAVAAQLDNEKLLSLALANLDVADLDAIPVTQKFDFDPANGTATITVSGIATPSWQHENQVYTLRPATAISALRLKSDRSRPVWRDIPVDMGAPSFTVTTTHIHLPDGGRGILLQGDTAQDLVIGGRHYLRKATLDGGLLTIEEQAANSGAELPTSDLPIARTKLATAQERVLRLATNSRYPAPYQQIALGMKAHKLDKLASLYTAFVAAKPDDADRYITRAEFYEATFQRNLALADLDKAVSLDGNVSTLLRRAELLEAMGQKTKAQADYQAALEIDPSSKAALTGLGLLEIDSGHKDAALASVEDHLANADDDKPTWLMIKAELLARASDAKGALAAIDEAIAIKSANPLLLNARCWIKGTLAIELDSAIQDCSRAIELTDDNTAELDSRAMVFFRLNRLADALADLNAALDRQPATPGSLYLRAVVEREMGKTDEAARDAANARELAPRIDEDYARWKIKA